MSRHQAYRNYDYEKDLDEFDGGNESGDELSPEDRALMTRGTADVRELLGGESSKVTTAQIEEALWHYYYDVDKSVAYLIGKYIEPPAKKPQAAPKNGAQELFRDMPWGNIPKHRETTFIAPLHPRGGLLGGSSGTSKMSKLQALAASRKKKTEEKKAEDKTEKTQRHLGELSLGDAEGKKKENFPREGGFSKRVKLSDTSSAGRAPLEDIGPRASPNARQQQQQQSAPPVAEGVSTGPHTETAEQSGDGSIATPEPLKPSFFAQTLLGSASESPGPSRNQAYSLPYLSLSASTGDAFAQPSPDDVVLEAQSKAGKKNPPPAKKAGADGKGEAAAEGSGAPKVDSQPLPKSKGLNVLSEFEQSKSKKAASFVVVGHVDAGKSTIMGRLLVDLEVIDQRTVDKYRKQADTMGKGSFALAWVLDQGSEERARGVTIDIATSQFETEDTVFTVLDAPGHKDFIPNMIAGASQADFAVLVIDASIGAFEAGLKGQTKEHALLIRSMGVSRIIVAVNKLDMVGWSKERFDEISDQISGFLTATGFQAKNITFVPVAGLHGDNIVFKSEDPRVAWYTGDTLVKELDKSEPAARAMDKPLRLTISEIFRTTTSPVAVSGKIDAGSLQTGDALLIQPSGERAYVKSLERDGQPVDWAVAGQRVVIHLTQIDPIHVRVGDIVCDPNSPIPTVDTFNLKALAFEVLLPSEVDIHRGRLHASGRIEKLTALLDKVTGEVSRKNPRSVKPASVARIRIKLDTKVPLEAGQRVILRSGGATVAAGLLE